MNALSLFNGMGCLALSLEQLGIKANIYSSEIDPHANRVAQALCPGTRQLGDVRAVRDAICTDVKYPDMQEQAAQVRAQIEGVQFDLVTAGSPCQGFSKLGHRLDFEDERSKLIEDFFDILKALQEQNETILFLLENVRMSKACLGVITHRIGVNSLFINSKLVSVQSRPRHYWTNIRINTQTRLFPPYDVDIAMPPNRGGGGAGGCARAQPVSKFDDDTKP